MPLPERERGQNRSSVIRTEQGEVIVRIAGGDGLEYERRSPFYIGGLWAVSAWAMATNLAQAFWRKFRDGGAPLGKILWELGRNPDHISSSFVDRFSRFNHRAKYGAAGWRSLELFYNYHGQVAPQLQSDLEGVLTRHWMEKKENRQAVANRYRPHRKAVELVRRIREHLPAGGIFLTCNIRGNREQIFLQWVLLWPMIYRSEREFADILLQGGFAPEQIDLLYEPHRIHGIACCRK